MSGVVSVGAAVGMSALAATSVATAGMTMASTFAVIGAVGAVAGAVGKLTGVKELAIGGAALGAVGGIGSLAAGAGLFGAAGDITAAAAPAGGYTATVGADGLGTLSSAGDAGGLFGSVGDLISGKGLTSDVIGGITGTPAPSNTLPFPVDHFGQAIQQGGGEGGTLGVGNNPAATGGNTPGSLQSGGPTVAPAAAPGPAPTTPLPGIINSANPPVAAGPYQATMPGADIPIVTLKAGETQPTTEMPAGGDSAWSGIMSWINKNPTLAMGGVMAASSFLQGAFNPKTGAEVDALGAQAGQAQANTGLINTQQQLAQTQLENIKQPIPRATRTRTNTGGLINRPAAG